MALHNASLAELGAAQTTYPPNSQQSLYAPNLGTAVSSSMHLTNPSHESEVGATGYKMDHEMMYYPVSVSFRKKKYIKNMHYINSKLLFDFHLYNRTQHLN